jgi:hypothetical protein
VRHRGIGQELRGVERQILELLEKLQLVNALVGHIGERQVELPEGLQRDDEVEVVVGCPRALERHLGDVAVAIAYDPPASLLDTLDRCCHRSRGGLARLRGRRRRGGKQRDENRGGHRTPRMTLRPAVSAGIEAPVDFGFLRFFSA